MKILITGATGNVGRHLIAHLLALRVAVRALTRQKPAVATTSTPRSAIPSNNRATGTLSAPHISRREIAIVTHTGAPPDRVRPATLERRGPLYCTYRMQMRGDAVPRLNEDTTRSMVHCPTITSALNVRLCLRSTPPSHSRSGSSHADAGRPAAARRNAPRAWPRMSSPNSTRAWAAPHAAARRRAARRRPPSVSLSAGQPGGEDVDGRDLAPVDNAGVAEVGHPGPVVGADGGACRSFSAYQVSWPPAPARRQCRGRRIRCTVIRSGSGAVVNHASPPRRTARAHRARPAAGGRSPFHPPSSTTQWPSCEV